MRYSISKKKKNRVEGWEEKGKASEPSMARAFKLFAEVQLRLAESAYSEVGW